MKRILFCLCFSVFLFSCSSDDSQSQNVEEENFYALTVGNSWVYKNYKYNQQTENYDYVGVIDSVSILSTEDINGNEYFKFRRLITGNEDGIIFEHPNGESFSFLRDSLGYLVNELGEIQFSNNDFNDRVVSEEIWGTIIERLNEGIFEVTVEAGTFNCLEMELFAILSNNGDLSSGKDLTYYSDEFGLIFETQSFVNTEIHVIERRLDSFNVQ